MALISRRWRGGRIIIIRVRASRCGESALNPPTPQPIPRRRSAPAPAERHALPAHLHSPTQRRCTPADLTTHSPPKTFARPRTLPLPHAAPTHTRKLRDARPPTSQHILRRKPAPAPAQRHALPEHFLTPSPHTSAPPPRDDARPPTSQHIPRRRSAPTPAQRRALPLPSCHIPAAQTHARRPHHPFLAEACHPSPHSAALPLLLFRFGHKKTAPHSACAMPNVSVDRRCGRSFGLVSHALFAAVTGRWRVGVGLRPQPWALRSRRCGRVLRA